MIYRALRGVCIGPGRHLVPAETADLDPATGRFLVNIGAVEEVKAPSPEPASEPPPEAPADGKSTPDKPGKSKEK